jgi:hypothetical protein
MYYTERAKSARKEESMVFKFPKWESLSFPLSREERKNFRVPVYNAKKERNVTEAPESLTMTTVE